MKYRSLINAFKSFSSPQPLRDWLLVLALGFILLVVLFGISLLAFFGVQGSDVIPPEVVEGSGIVRIPTDDLKQVVATLEARKSAFESDSISVPSLKDPSK